MNTWPDFSDGQLNAAGLVNMAKVTQPVKTAEALIYICESELNLFHCFWV